MNCLILVLLLLCCGNNGTGSTGSDGCGENRPSRRNCGCDDSDSRNDGNCRERSNEDDCGCRRDFRPEPRFEQRPFMFNQNSDCGCEREDSRGCDCGCDR